MDPEAWQHAKDLFSQALEREPRQRPAFLSHACGGDERLRQEVEYLLAAHQDADMLAMEIAVARLAAIPEDANVGRRIGAYQVVKRIGQGGMASVYLAFRADDQYRKQVAIKVVRSETASPNLLQRFRNERQTLAELEHPNVVRFLDGGATLEGQPYLVMEFVEGTAITDYADSHRLSIDERLKLFRAVCEAVSYAHQRLVIHRDLKPSNILVSADGTPKLLDFGIAKLLNPQAAATLVVTQTGQQLMTPQYASPEQIRGEPLTNGTDVYSLGVVLYELLTGHHPHRTKSQSLVDIERAICEEEPTMPSTVVTRTREHMTPEGTFVSVMPEAVCRLRQGDPKKLSSKLHGDLDATGMMALRKEPQRRYFSVYDFSEDIRKHLEGLPVKARPNTLIYRGTKFLHRHKDAAVAVVVVLFLGALLAAGGFLYSRTTQVRLATRTTPGTQSQPVSATSTDLPAAKYGWHEGTLPAEISMPDLLALGADYNSPQLLLFGAASLRVWDPGQAGQPPLPLGFAIAGRADCAAQLWLIHDDHRHITSWDMTKQRALRTITLPWSVQSGACLDDKGGRWAFLVSDSQFSRVIEFDAGRNQILQTTRLDGPYFDAVFDDQRRSVVLIGDNRISIRRRSGVLETFHDSPPESFFHVARRWSPSGRYLALGFKQLLVYDVETKRRLNTLSTKGWIQDIGWIGEDGLSAMDDRGRLYWTSNLSRGWELTDEPASESVYRELWDPTNLRWVRADRSGRVLTWAYVSPSVTLSIPISNLGIWSIASNGAGSTVAVSGKNPRIQIVDLKQQKVVRTLEGHTDGVTFVRFDPYHRLISAGDDATLRVWDPDTGNLLQTAHGHRSLINAFAISPNGRWLVSVSSDKAIKLWELPAMIWKKDLGMTKNSGAAVAFLPDADGRFVVSDWSGWLYLYEGEAPNWRVRQQFRLNNAEIYMLCPSRKGWWATMASGDKAGLWLVPASDLRQATQVSNIPAVYCSTSDDGRLTAIVNGTGIEVRSNSSGKPEAAFYFANEAVTVAIQEHPPTVMTEANGKLMTWPLAEK